MANRADKTKGVLHALSLDTIGGVEVLFRDYLRQAQSDDLEHHVLVMRKPVHSALAPEIDKLTNSISYAKYRQGLKIPSWPAFFRTRHLYSILRTIQPDVIVNYNALGNLALWEAASRVKAAKVYYERGAAWMPHDKATVSGFLAQADAVICNSNAARRMLELRWGLEQGSAGVILNPLRDNLAAANISPRMLNANQPPRLGVAGRIIPLKGFPLAIHALRLLHDAGIKSELHIAGEGPEEQSLRTLTNQLELTDWVHFRGHMTDMSAFYRELDIFLCPSLREPLGNVCIEAGYWGAVVICAAIDGLPEAVQDGKTGFCIKPTLPIDRYAELGGNAARPPEYVYDPVSDSLVKPKLLDPQQIAAAIRSLFEHPETFAEMSAAAHARICEAFGLTEYVKKVNEAILEAIKQR